MFTFSGNKSRDYEQENYSFIYFFHYKNNLENYLRDFELEAISYTDQCQKSRNVNLFAILNTCKSAL